MNFHKTIGYLATLLLILGIGVPDSFAQETKTVDISFPDDFRLKRIREGRTVTVSAILSEAPAENETVTLTLDLEVPAGDSIRYDVGDNKYVAVGEADETEYFLYTLTDGNIDVTSSPSTSSQQPEVEISGDETTNSLTLTSVANGIYRHPRIDSVAVSLAETDPIGSSEGGTNDWTEADADKVLKFGLQEAEDSLGSITVNSFVPPSLSQGVTSDQSVIVKVTVDIVAAVNVVTTVTVGLSYEFLGADGNAVSGVDKTTDETIDVTVPIDGLTNKGSTTSITFTADQTRAQDGQDAAVTNIKVTASLAGYTPDDKTLAVIDREADTLQGFQVFVVETDNAWKKTVKEHIKVQVIRHKAIAFPWESFASIRIALHDSTGVDADNDGLEDDEKVQLDPRYGMPDNLPPAISHITVKNLVVDGKLSFQAVSVPSGGADKSKATYKDVDKDTEMIEFLMGVPNNWASADQPATVASGITSFHYPGTIVDGAYVPDRSQEIDFHRYEVFAVVLFSTDDAANADSDDRYLTSDDTGKSIYPRSPNLFSEKVGNGVHVRIDALKPDDGVIKDLALTINKEAPNVAKIGDKIRIAAKIGGGGEIFQEHKVQLKIVAQGQGAGFAVAYKGGAGDLVKTFTATQVFGVSSDSLRFEYEVDPGKFQVKAKDPAANAADFATLQSHPVYGDGSPIGKNELFDGVGLEGKAQVIVLDEAGNTAVENSATFDLDSGKPVVTVVYPKPTAPDSNRISGAYEAEAGDDVEDVSEFLRPLRFAVNEETTRRAVFIVGGPDTLDLTDSDGDFHANRDSIRYSTARRYDDDTEHPERRGEGLHVNLKEKADADDEYEGTGQGGAEIELAILVEDAVGNRETVKIPGVYHDEMPPVLENWFPKNSLLEESDNKINVATLNPVLTLPEDVDSIAVTFSASAGDITQEKGDTAKGERQIEIDDAGSFQDGEDYTMTVFVRDLAGNVYISPADSSANMTFDAGFDNPKANSFAITTETDSVIAGQANKLTVQAADVSDEDETISRKALTYKNKDVDDNPAFDVLVSAWDIKAGEVAEKVWFEGKGVDDDAENPDGMATLDADGWVLGKRTIHAKSNQAYDHIKVLIQHRTAGEDGTGASLFSGELDELYVGAADFAGFKVTAEQDGFEEIESGSEFTLKVVPADDHGNASERAFKAAEDGTIDSLSILDTRVEDSGAFDYEEGFEVTFSTAPVYEDLRFDWTVGKDGLEFLLIAPEDRSLITIQTKLVKDALDTDDDRSRSIRSQTDRFKVVSPLMPALTLWPEGVEVDGKVAIPADPGEVTVTVRADGYKTDVTFTVDGVDLGTTAADEATVDVTRSEDATVTVSATDGRYPVERTIVFESVPAEQMRVRHWADAEMTVPVYLIDLTDNTVDLGDYSLFRAAWGKSAADDINGDGTADDTDAQIFLQADINGDGMVDLADYEMFLMSWGKTAVGPASKPLVLLPGVNENAEFSLSLGSERVVAGELVAVDVSLANVEALVSYGFTLNYETDKFEFISVAPADEDLLKSTGGETPLFHHIVADDGQVEVVNGMVHGSAVSGGGDIVRFVFRVLLEFEDNARFEIADGLVLDPTNLSNPAVVAGVLELQSTPREFALRQNFPNPFNPDTTIKYDLAESADVTLQIYNVLGQVVRTLVGSEAQNAGRYQIRWNGMDDRGVPVSSGVYFYQISAEGKFHDVRKLMLLK